MKDINIKTWEAEEKLKVMVSLERKVPMQFMGNKHLLSLKKQ